MGLIHVHVQIVYAYEVRRAKHTEHWRQRLRGCDGELAELLALLRWRRQRTHPNVHGHVIEESTVNIRAHRLSHAGSASCLLSLGTVLLSLGTAPILLSSRTVLLSLGTVPILLSSRTVLLSSGTAPILPVSPVA